MCVRDQNPVWFLVITVQQLVVRCAEAPKLARDISFRILFELEQQPTGCSWFLIL